MKHPILYAILAVTLALTPAFAQKRGGGQIKMRGQLETAVKNGNLNEQERQKYEQALKALDEARGKRQAGEKLDRNATRQAMRDLQEIAKSENLRPEDREQLAKAMKPKGRRGR
jgi:pantothenate synthetase